MKEIKVAELFAGVGGFRIGLEKASDKFKVVCLKTFCARATYCAKPINLAL